VEVGEEEVLSADGFGILACKSVDKNCTDAYRFRKKG
jgi:hypothetical protein